MTNTNTNTEFILHLTNARMEKQESIDYLLDTYTPQVREYIATHKESDLEASVDTVFTTAFEQLQTFRGDSSAFAAYLYEIIHQKIALDLLDSDDFVTAEHHKVLSLNIFFGLSYEQIATLSSSTPLHIQNLATQATQKLINQKNRTSGTSAEKTETEKTSLASRHERTGLQNPEQRSDNDKQDSETNDIFGDVQIIQEEQPTQTNSNVAAPQNETETEATAETPQVSFDEEEKPSRKKLLLLLSVITLLVLAGASATYLVWNGSYRATATAAAETTLTPNTLLASTTQQNSTTTKITATTKNSVAVDSAEVLTTTKEIVQSTTTQKPTTTVRPTTSAKPIPSTAPTTTLIESFLAPPQSCEVQLWDNLSAGVEVFEPTQNFRPNYIFYNSKLEQIKQTKNLEAPQRDDPQELEWLAVTNGFRTNQVFYVAANNGQQTSIPVLCQRVTR